MAIEPGVAGFHHPSSGPPARDAHRCGWRRHAPGRWHPGPFGEDRAFRPFFALSVGLAAVFPLPKGALVMAPSAERKLCSPFRRTPRALAARSRRRPRPAPTPPKRLWAEELVQMPVMFKAFHCMPVRKTSRMASMALLSGTRERWQPKGCEGRSGRRGSIFSHRESGIRQPSSRSTSPMLPPPTRWSDGRPTSEFDMGCRSPFEIGPSVAGRYHPTRSRLGVTASHPRLQPSWSIPGPIPCSPDRG